MSRLVSLKTELGSIRPHTLKVFDEVAAHWKIWYAWGKGASGEHKQGRALDFMTLTSDQQGLRKDVGEQISAYVWKNRKRLGVWYVIWNRRIISMTFESQGWRAYDGDNPHTDHVHVSFKDDPPAYRPPGSANGPIAMPSGHEPFPGAAFFTIGRNSPIITAMGRRLVAEGCGKHYQSGPGPTLSKADLANYADWQRKLGFTGGDADGVPGKTSWTRLRVPNV